MINIREKQKALKRDRDCQMIEGGENLKLSDQ